MESSKDGSGNHESFLKHLDASMDGVMWATRWLASKGYDVVVKHMSRSPSRDQWKEHADQGDLYILQRIEVKHLGVSFTGPGDWPFGKKFIVCAKHSFDAATPKPFAYMIISQDKKCSAIVRADTSDQWLVEKKKDSRYDNVSQLFYLAPMECVKFVPC